jgi:hypothetical protein
MPSMNTPAVSLPTEDLDRLRWAYEQLEHPSFAARLSNVIGRPIEQGLELLPTAWYQRAHDAALLAIHGVLRVAIGSFGRLPPSGTHDWLHKLAAAAAGAAGGLLGPLTLLAELPLTTVLMLRSIAEIARNEGEDLDNAEARLACVQVFALGGRTDRDRAADTGYYGLRLTLGLHFSFAPLHTTAASSPSSIPGGIEFIRGVAARFGSTVSDSVAAKLIPIAGAVSGALLNLAFMQHYQDIARGHFIVRRLERTHGADAIRILYEEVAREQAEAGREFSPLEGW